MEETRVEASKKRLEERITTAKEYLEKEQYDINELTRSKNQLEKKNEQFEKDVQMYELRSKRTKTKSKTTKNIW